MKHVSRIGLAAAALVLMTSGLAHAESSVRKGWYVGAGALATFPTDAESSVANVDNTIEYKTGWGVSASGGYAWGNGLRTELETAYRKADVKSVTGAGSGAADGDLGVLNVMGNLLYDFDTGTIFTPYVGAGIGTAFVDATRIRTVNGRSLDNEHLKFAYQGIVGVETALDDNWSVTADYRYLATNDIDFKTSAGDFAKTEYASHNVMLGVRYAFGEPAPVPALQTASAPVIPAAQATTPTVPAVPQSYMVFFDFDRSVLTPEAKHIIASAAQNFKSAGYVRVTVTGHTDTMGKPQYNKRLSLRRAKAVEKEFLALGVPASAIGLVGAGESGLMIPTNDQVREAQNRRAEIVFGK